MTITTVHNRNDWYIASQKIDSKYYFALATTRIAAIKDVITQLKAFNPCGHAKPLCSPTICGNDIPF